MLLHEASIIATKERAEMKMIEFFIARKIALTALAMQSQSAVRRKACRNSRWQRVGNQIDAAFIFARTDCVNMHSGWLRHMVSRDAVIALICPPPVLAAFFL